MPDQINFLPAQNRIPMGLFLHVFYRALIVFSAIAITSLTAFGQDEEQQPRRGSRVIDDTTRQVYGPNTSKYYYEKDVFYNREIYYPIDTLIRNFHRWNYVQRNNNFYQDLGNVGTAIRPIYYQSPDVIGVSSGFHSYDVYWDADPVKYYDTKSPFSNMKVDLGGKGRSLTRVNFSRNINPRWNFGFTYRGMFVDKQIQRDGKGDRNMKANYYDLYTAYQSKDSTYRLFFNLQRNYHRVFENGGVQVSSNYSYDDFFLDNIRPWLTDAETNELKTNYHLFHQYKIGKALQLYHQFDRTRQGNRFIDSYSLEPPEYFDYIEIDSAKSYDYAKFKSVRNEVGIKGSLGKLFYNGYYALRHYSMTYTRLATDTLLVRTNGNESYLGGRISLKLDSLVEVNGWGELLQTGNYRLQGEIKSKWFEASLQQMQYAPGFVMQAYRGAHDAWNNNFDDIESTRINGYLHYNSKWLSVSPGLTFTRIRNYTFFDFSNPEELEEFQTVLPVQSSGNQVFASPELRIAIRFLRHVELSGQGIYTSFIENADDAMRIPRVFVNGQISYANIFFHGNLDMHAGVDVHWKSAYKAPAYDPVIQQFYNQDSFTNPDFPVIDIFFNAKIKRGRIYVKYNNLVNAITRSGYLPTPYYPGQRSVIDFGFDWSFYD